MIANRSVPGDTLIPHITYRDVTEASAWLTRTFGFIEHFRYGDPVRGAQMHLGPAWIMIKMERADSRTPAQLGFCTQSLTIFVEDVEAHHARTKASGPPSSKNRTRPSTKNSSTPP